MYYSDNEFELNEKKIIIMNMLIKNQIKLIIMIIIIIIYSK